MAARNHIVTASVSKKGKGGKRKTREVRIRPAENGFTVAHDTEPGGDEKAMYQPPTETVHETPESMLEHVGSIFGAKKGKPAPATEPDGDEDEEVEE